jgi:hypoxanthine-DNA glycosylase
MKKIEARAEERTFHQISPVWDSDSRILILGSFPSVKSREAGFFYGHPQNRFWKVMAAVLEAPVPATIEEKRAMLLHNHIALWDVIASCRITGSSDSSIKDVVPNPIGEILEQAQIVQICANGATAWKLYEKYIRDMVRMEAVRLPSTSPANAAWSLERLIEEWRAVLRT